MTAPLTTQTVEAWVRAFGTLVDEQRVHLTELDSAVGDADHGSNMDRGLKAAVAALDENPPDSPAAAFTTVGRTLMATVGGTSGALFGTFFLRMAGSVTGATELTPDQFAAAVRAGLDGVLARGKPELGDKTMYDALGPGVDALESALAQAADLPAALSSALQAAERGRDATAAMVARKGRGSYLGDRSLGHQDPGAATAALMIRAAAHAMAAD